MNRFRLLLVAIGLVVLGIALTQPVKATIATQQAQIGFTIIVNVTPSPMPTTTPLLGYAPQHTSDASGRPSISAVSLRRAMPDLRRAFRAESLHFDGGSMLVAQAQVQHGVLVQAEVTPNPKATILYTDIGAAPASSVTLDQTAGTTVQYACAFTVTVDMLTTWVLDQGLSNDFASDFSGKELANNTYAATPMPTSTPYVVYADDGKVWSQMATGTTKTTYCVTLTLTIPGTTDSGSYSTNAIYTLYN
ncbi:MAG: hypothetical protein WBD74_12295 [Candidatus Aquilonibacter sp.]